jgi:hypothetical protein
MGMLSTGFGRAAELLPAIEDSRKEDAWTGNGPDTNTVIEDILVLGTYIEIKLLFYYIINVIMKERLEESSFTNLFIVTME